MKKTAIIALTASIAVIDYSAAVAQTPWALIARKAVGRVTQMTQEAPPPGAAGGQTGGYDVATVMLDADAGKVFAVALDRALHNPKVTVVSRDAVARRLELQSGTRMAGLTVNALGTGLSQLLVASVRPPGEPSSTAQIVDGILRICTQMKVQCSTQ